jgi:hypothetical protein
MLRFKGYTLKGYTLKGCVPGYEGTCCVLRVTHLRVTH